MKIRTVILALLGLAFASSFLAAEETVEAPKKVQMAGAGTYGQETLESLTTTGLVKLNRTNISQNLNVNGCVIAHGAEIGSLDVVGEANLTDTRILRGGTVLGHLSTHQVIIEKPIILNSQKSTFTGSKLKGITIRPMDAFKGKQIIELRQKTIVDGPISFESGRGEVHLYSGSQVTGPVTGGKIIKKH